ncbi:unnamed protein product, partial [Tilletia caries]
MGLGMEEGMIRSDEEEFSSSDEEGTDTDDPLESRHNRDRSPPDDGDGSEFLDEVGSELLAELIGDYILGDKPTGHGGRRRNLTAVEKLSLKHYRRWLRTFGTTEALKAMFHNPTMSQLLRYRHERLQDLQKARDTQAWDAFVFKDTVDGLNNLTLAAKGVLEEPRDIALAIATDGAQLTANKDSSVWIITAACLNTPPEVRFQRAHQFVLAIIPGPNAPGDIESFFQPILQEMAQLSVGAWVWDGFTEKWVAMVMPAADRRTADSSRPATGMDLRLPAAIDRGLVEGSNREPTGSGSTSTTAPDLSQKAGKTPYFPLKTPTSLRTLPNNRTRPSAYDPVALPLRTHAIYEDHVAE